ncbi:cold-inducible protein YdjO-related protein [Paenibacillus sp. GD4]|uniref:cold-inducible protein YdjO-related protein n=1 Tax=Paenibacillus TaxID=44249 RepID=UPI00254327DE|nr:MULTISPECIES: cold-inducible protein YdjO-related protein [Paenibacillus]MDQ1909908.1 cold-inducible protein YdjO-related protein [Paenibacillus sp. GD4]
MEQDEIKPELFPTPILKCRNPDCKAWVREELASPTRECPLCRGEMLRSFKHLPKIVKKAKSTKKKKEEFSWLQ